MATSAGRNRILAALILLCGIIGAVVLVKMRPEPPRRTAAVPVPMVEAWEVRATRPEIVIEGFGPVRARRRITLIPEVSGVVISKSPKFEPGEYFEAGEVLMTIDDTNYRAVRENSAASLAQARLALARAEEEAAVAKQEWQLSGRDESGTDPSPLVMHEPQLDAARATMAAAEAALARADKDLARCHLTTPFEGRVLSSDVDAGQFVGAGSRVGAIYATDVLEVTIPMNDEDLAWIQAPVGDTPGSAVVLKAEFAGSSHEWAGRVTRIGAAVDEASRQIPVIIEVEGSASNTLMEGIFVTAEILAEAEAGAIVIPRKLLHTGDMVWVIGDDRRLEIRPVTVARSGADEVVVSDGLIAGERLCASSLQYATNGMQIRLVGDKSPAEGPTGEPGAGAGGGHGE